MAFALIPLRVLSAPLHRAAAEDPWRTDLFEVGAVCRVEAAQSSTEVNAAVAPPVINSNPSGGTFDEGSTVSLFVSATGEGLTYQWFKSGVAISGATSNAYQIFSATAAQSGNYTVVVANSAGFVTSSVASVVIALAPLPTFLMQPADVSALVGDSVSFSAWATSSVALSFQWLKDGVEIPGGVSSSLYLRNTVTLADAGEYALRVTNSSGSVISAIARLTVRPSPPPVLNVTARTWLDVGASTTLSVQTIGSRGPFTYQWYRGVDPISGATSSTLALSNLRTSDFGDYFVVVTNSAGTSVSPNITVAARPVWWSSPPGSGRIWCASAESDGVVYFLFRTPRRLSRYDLASARWLADLELPGDPRAMAVEGGRIYLALGTSIYRFESDPDALTQIVDTKEPITGLAVADGSLVCANEANLRTYSLSTGALQRLTSLATYQYYGFFSRSMVYNAANQQVYGASSLLSYANIGSLGVGPNGSLGAVHDLPYKPAVEDRAPQVFLLDRGTRVASASGIVYRADDLTMAGSFGRAVDDLVALPDGTYLTLAQGDVRAHDRMYRETGRALFDEAVAKIAVIGDQLVGFVGPATSGAKPVVITLPRSSLTEVRREPAVRTSPPSAMAVPQILSDGSGVIGVYSKLDRQIYRWSVFDGRWLESQPLPWAVDRVMPLGREDAHVYLRGDTQLRRIARLGSDEPLAVSLASANALFDFTPGVAANGSLLSAFRADGSLHSWHAMPIEAALEWSSARRELFGAGSRPFAIGVDAAGAFLPTDRGPDYSGTYSISRFRASPDGATLWGDPNQLFDSASLSRMSVFERVDLADATWVGETLYTLVYTSSGEARLQARSRSTGEVQRAKDFSGVPLRIVTVPGGQLVLVTYAAGAPVMRLLDPSTLGVVVPGSTSLEIVRQPKAAAGALGNRIALVVDARGNGPLSYQWFKNGGLIPGATTRELVITSLTANDEGRYMVKVSSGVHALSSDEAQVRVLIPPSITVEPQNVFVAPGDSAAFSVTATGDGPLSYRWSVNGVECAQTGATFNYGPIEAGVLAQVRVVVLNAAGAATSRIVIGATNSAPVIAAVEVPHAVLNTGDDLRLSVRLSDGAAGATYRWQRDGEDIVGAEGATLVVPNATTAASGRYSVTVTNAFGSATSVLVPMQVMSASPVVATKGNAVFLKADGSLWAAAYGVSAVKGNLAKGVTEGIATDVVAFTPDAGSVYYLKRDGALYFYPSLTPLATDVVAFAVGYYRLFIIKRDGSLWAKGNNWGGQLGDGTTTDRAEFVRVLGSVRAVHANGDSTYAIRTDGTLWAWGNNAYGQLANGNTTNSSLPVQIMAGVREVRGTSGSSIAILTNDGTLLTAGQKDGGRLGVPPNTAGSGPFTVASDVRSMDCGGAGLMFLKLNGDLYCAGYGSWGGSATNSGTQLPLKVAGGVAKASSDFSWTLLFTRTDGTLWGMGFSSGGALGSASGPSAPFVATPVEIVSQAVATVHAAGLTTYFITPAGSLYGMGEGLSGSAEPTLLASGSLTAPDAPTGLKSEQWGNEIVVTWNPIAGVTEYEIWRRGIGEASASLVATTSLAGSYWDQPPTSGQYVYSIRARRLGETSVAAPEVVTPLPTVPVITQHPAGRTVIDGARQVQFAVTATGVSTYQWRRDGQTLEDGGNITGAHTATLMLASVGSGEGGTYDVVLTNPNGASTSSGALLVVRPATVSFTAAMQSIDGRPHVYALGVTANGAWSVASDSTWASVGPARGVGDATLTVVADANLTGIPRTATLTIGSQQHVVTQAAAPGDARQVWFAGSDAYGQLAQGRQLVRKKFGLALAGVKRAVAVGGATYFIRTDDSLWFAGVDLSRTKGVSDDSHCSSPTQLASSVAKVSVDESHLLFITLDGVLWGAGVDYYGQLGTATVQAGANPQAPRVIDSGVRDIAAGEGRSLFVKADGSVWGLGSSTGGLLGANLLDGIQESPVRIGENASAVSAGYAHSALLKLDGTLWMTGQNSAGQLGTGDTNPRRDWVQVASGVVQVLCSQSTTFFRKADGSLWGMGGNYYGQLGGTDWTVLVPRRIATGVRAFAGSGHYVTEDGVLWDRGARVVDPVFDTPSRFMSDVVDVSGDITNTVCVRADGTAWTFGSDSQGQLGAHTRLDSSIPLRVGEDGVQVGIGERNAVWLDTAGDLHRAGYNYSMLAFPDGLATESQVVATGIAYASISSSHTLYGKADGSLLGDGRSDYGALGMLRNYPGGSVTVQADALRGWAGPAVSFFIKADRTLWALGSNIYGQLGDGTKTSTAQPVQVLDQVATVAIGSHHTVALRTDGSLWVTGQNSNGQLGTGDTLERTRFTQVDSGVRAVAAGGEFTAWVRVDGTAWIAGSMPIILQGNGSPGVPRQFDHGVVTVSAGQDSLHVLKDGGALWVAGANGCGQLGDGSFVTRRSLVQIASDVLATAAGERNSAFIAPEGFFSASRPPTITVQPQPYGAALQGTATLAVVATGQGPLHYQWQRNGVDIAGATGSVLTIPSVTPAETGLYRVVVSNSAGAIHSVLVPISLTTPPVIITQPQSVAAIAGETVSLTVVAEGGALSYQWSRDGVPIEGATDATLRLTGLTSGDAGLYRVLVSNGAGSILSAVASVAVGHQGIPTITVEPGDQITGTNGRVAFRVIATGNPAPSYQWQRLPAGGVTWEPVARDYGYVFADRDATLLVSSNPYTAGSGDQFRVVVANASGSVVSRAATLTVSGEVGPTSISGGYSMTAYMVGDGYACVTGANYTGQLGDGTRNQRLTPGRLWGQGGAVAVQAGYEHTLLFMMDGSLSMCGDNQYGQLADGTLSPSTTPKRVTHGITGGSGGYRHTLYTLYDGRLYAAGLNTSGQLGIGVATTSTPNYYSVRVSDNVVATAAGHTHSLFVKGDGTAWAMGSNDGVYGNGTTAPSLLPVQVASGVAAVATYHHTAFLKRDGTVWTTGPNSRGQLGDGTQTSRTTATPVATGVVEVAVGAAHTVMLKSDGTAWTVGANDRGQLGDGTRIDRATPLQVATEVFAISAGHYTTILLKKDGTVWITGANDVGQLGDGTTTDRAVFGLLANGNPSLPLDQVSPAATNSESANFIALSWLPSRGATFYRIWRHTSDDPAAASLLVERVKGRYFEDRTAAPGVSYYYWTQPVNPSGALPLGSPGLGRSGASSQPPSIITQPLDQDLKVGGTTALRVVAGGVGPFTYQWSKDGADISGATGDVLTITDAALEQTGAYRVRVASGGGAVFSNIAQLTVTRAIPTIITPPIGGSFLYGASVTLTVVPAGTPPFTFQWFRDGQPIPGANSSTYTLSNLSAVDAANYFVRVTNLAGSVDSAAVQLQVSPPPPAIVQAAVGYQHAGYVRADGKLFMMGTNSSGQLGDGSTTRRVSPVEVASEVVQVAAGIAHTVFLKQDGTLWGMGSDSSAQMGGRGAKLSPVQLASEVVAVKAAGYSTVFLQRDGTLWGMGQNAWFMFGSGPNQYPTPKRLGTEVVDFSLASQQVGFVRRDGTAWVCGFNRNGQLGVVAGDVTNFTTVLSDASRIRVSGGTTFITRRDGTLWAAGANGYGQLGDGTTNRQLSPVRTMGSGIVDAASGAKRFNNSLWLRNDGALLWVGTDTSVGSTVTTPAIIANQVTSIAFGEVVLWIKADGTLVGLGDNIDGALGLADAQYATMPGRTIATGLPQIPDLVTGLNATTGTVDAGVRLQWTPVFGATTYEIWRGTTSDPAAAVRLMTDLGTPLYYDNTATENTTYYYHVRAVSPAGVGPRSATVAGVAGARPTISASPVSRSLLAGAPVTFSVTATGTEPFTYQWRRNGVPIPGATTPSYSIDSALLTDAGDYDVMVSNVIAVAFSNIATLTVTKRTQNITFDPPSTLLLTRTPLALVATSSSNLPVSLELDFGLPFVTLDGSTLTMLGRGTIGIRATQPGDSIYQPAAVVIRTVTITENATSWQTYHFSTEEQQNPAISGPNADPDGDGVPNLVEYALGLDPRNASNSGGPAVENSSGNWSFTFTRPADRTDVGYTVECSTNLTSWSSDGVTLTRVATVDGIDTWRATYPSASAPSCFFRLVVTR